MQSSISRFFSKVKSAAEKPTASKSKASPSAIDLTGGGDDEALNTDETSESCLDSALKSDINTVDMRARLEAVEPNELRAHRFATALIAMQRSLGGDGEGLSGTKGTGKGSKELFQLLSVPPGTKLTPLESQVVETKLRYPDCLLMVHVGYKIRCFGT